MLTKKEIDMELTLPEYSLDFSKPITAKGNFGITEQNLKSQLDTTIIDKKLATWDKVIKGQYLLDNGMDKNNHYNLNNNSSLNSEQRLNRMKYYRYLKSVQLLKDKTIFAYSQFRFDNKPLIMRYYQDALLSDKSKRILFAAANQIGKSITLDTDAAYEFCQDHNKSWVGLLVSKSLDQSEYQMMRIKSMLKTAGINYREESTTDKNTGKKDNSVKISYTFYDTDTNKPKYENLLICCPPTGSALGYPCDNLWLDEFDFWKDIDGHWFIHQIAIPRTFETKGIIKIFTNPNGKSELWNLWNESFPDGRKVWHRYNFNYWDKLDATQDEFDLNSVGMTRSQMESTLLAIFSDNQDCLFTEDEIKRSYDPNLTEISMYPFENNPQNKQPFFFLDVGSKHDRSVLVGCFVEPDKDNDKFQHIYIPIIQVYPVGYPLSRVIAGEGDPSDGWQYIKSVKDYLIEYSRFGVNPVFGLDVTGNSGISPLCQAHNINPIDVTFSGPVKSGMYQRYKYFMEKGLLHRVKSTDFEYEASKLRMKKGTRGYWQIHHETEDDLDDSQDAVAAAIYLADRPVFTLPTLDFI